MYLPMSLPPSPLLVGNMSLVVSGTALREEVVWVRGAHVSGGIAWVLRWGIRNRDFLFR